MDVIFGDKSRLFQLSFLMLFIELILIRWTGSNVVYLSYFSNFILLGSFLGIGLGFLRPSSSDRLFYWSPIALAFFVCFIQLFPVSLNRSGEELIYFGDLGDTSNIPLWAYLPFIFLTVCAIMTSIADGVARTFRKFPPLTAYRLDILGSLTGIIVFSLLSFLNTSPVYWGAIASLLFVSLFFQTWARHRMIAIFHLFSIALILITLAAESKPNNIFWSPYYKIKVTQDSDTLFRISVNGIPHQDIASVLDRLAKKQFYFVPYQRLSNPANLNNVLIVGAGTGSDVAIALSEGAKHVDAVEIDPVLYQLGKALNPDNPYQNPRVNVHINDGRAFLEQTKNLYDLIIFALPDSLTLVSGQSSLRLESYLFTLEGIKTASKHLTPNGVFAMYNFYREPWLVDRLANTLSIAFNHPPCVETYGATNYWLGVLMDSNSSSAIQCPTPWQGTDSPFAAPATDNHPFLYLKGDSIPTLYLTTLCFILLASLIAIKISGGSFNIIRNYLDLFLMGTAFLLLETKNIVNFALLFGATWFVNALVFIGILFTVYLAIEVSSHFTFKRKSILFSLLLLSLFVSWVIPSSSLLSLSLPARYLASITLAFSPIFIANLIFAERFQRTANSTFAFGANLIGTMLGGLLEYASLIIGYHYLLLIIAALYLLALALMSKQDWEASTI